MKKRGFAELIFAFIIVVVLIIGGNYYLSNLREAIWLQSVSGVLETTIQGSHAFEVYVEKDCESVNSLACRLSELNSTDSDGIIGRLQQYDEEDGIITVFDIEGGVTYSNWSSGELPLAEELIESVRWRTGSGLEEPYLNLYTGQRTLGYWESFTYADGYAGMVRKGQLIKDIAKEFSLSFYDGEGFSYIVDSSGEILIRTLNKNSGWTYLNIFEMIETAGNAPADVEKFRSSFSDGNSGAMLFDFRGEEYLFAYVPIKNTDGWYMVSVIPDAVISSRTEQTMQASQAFIFIFGLSILFVVIFVLVMRRNRRHVQEKERELKYREQLFSILATNTDELFLMLSADSGQVEYVSPNIERVLGISQQEAIANPRVIGTGESSFGFEDLKGISGGGEISRETHRIHRVTGESLYFEDTVYCACVDGMEKFIVVLSNRTAEEKHRAALKDALEIARAANAAKSSFLSSMSHDIRTPMNAIVGLAKLINRDADDPSRIREHARKISASSQHLLGLINDVLDMSKIESGNATLNIDSFSVAEIVDEIDTIMRPQAKSKNQDFEISVYELSDEHLLGDKLRINQILINLLSNAVKYTPEGGRVNMIVRQARTLTPGYANMQIVVSDNGIGMSQEYLGKIFQPFTRETTRETKNIQGTGLGMAITKNLVELMGGNISVESELGKGSVFTVHLELRIEQREDDAAFWSRNAVSSVLVIDDDEETCRSVCSALKDKKLGADYAVDRKSAVETIERKMALGGKFDVILLDWYIPGDDGADICRCLRDLLPDGTKIFILTASDWRDIVEDAQSAGADGYMPKPFFVSNFKNTIERTNSSVASIGLEVESMALEGMHFLAAEDNELNAEILTELLDMCGATCDIAENGQVALKKFENSQPGQYDAILMDVQMPVMDGYEATRAIRASVHERAGSIPIIAMTANAFAEDIRAAVEAGMDAHVPKPVDLDRLTEILRELSSHGRQ